MERRVNYWVHCHLFLLGTSRSSPLFRPVSTESFEGHANERKIKSINEGDDVTWIAGLHICWLEASQHLFNQWEVKTGQIASFSAFGVNDLYEPRNLIALSLNVVVKSINTLLTVFMTFDTEPLANRNSNKFTFTKTKLHSDLYLRSKAVSKLVRNSYYRNFPRNPDSKV